MPRFVRSSVRASGVIGRRSGLRRLAAGRASALGEAAKPRVPAVSFVPVSPADGSQARRAVSVRQILPPAHCEQVGCADGLVAADAAVLCSVCRDPTDLALSDLDRSRPEKLGTPLAISLAAFALELWGDPHPLYLGGIGPYAAAAPTPETSTAAMLTMGLVLLVWTVRRTRRPLPTRPKLCPG